MKHRNGFVSNSSSSSFVCAITGESFTVYDSDFAQSGLSRCVQGHVFLDKFLVPAVPVYPSREVMWAKLDEITDSKRECLRYREMGQLALEKTYREKVLHKSEGTSGDGVDVNQCPICTLTMLSDTDMLEYMLKTMGSTRQQVVEDIKKEFEGDYARFQRYLTSKAKRSN